jgi:predicted enzyme related to lactoylglutathione lyase
VADRVLGIGGVFFRCKDPKRLAAWYRRHLDVPVRSEGGQLFAVFSGKPGKRGARSPVTIWAPFPRSTAYFGSRRQPFMLNYVVADLDRILRKLRKERVRVIDGPIDSKLGRFAWILDGEGNRVELWEPPHR